MSEEGSFYTFNGHREALFLLLEATVRGDAGCPDNDNDNDNRPRNGEVGQTSAYPTPILWYDEMRPSDIDAYHAVNGRGRYGSDKRPSLEDPLVGSMPGPTPMEDRDGACSRSQSRAVFIGKGVGEGGAALRPEGRRPAASSIRRPAAEEALGERQGIIPGSAASTSGTPDRCMCAAAPTPPPPPSSTEHGSQSRHGEASSVPEEEREEDGDAAASSGSSSARDRRCSKPVEKNECPPMMMTPPATATTATTPPDPSQATQTMFLPGLPSQVLVTQQQGDEGWEHPEGDESSQKEEDAAASEYASPSPTHPPRPCAEEAAVAEASVASAGRKEPSDNGGINVRSEPDRSKSCSSDGDDPLVPSGEDRDEATSRQNDGFTRALREFLADGVGRAQSGALPNASGGGGGGGSGGDERRRPPFKYVPTLEVLPRGWSGRQSGVVACLEKHLSHAGARCPGGYAARALRLACHVLRQPTVCVRARGGRGGGAATAGAAAADDDHQGIRRSIDARLALVLLRRSPAPEPEVDRLERGRENILEGVRKGYEHAHLLLRRTAPQHPTADMDGREAALKAFPDSILAEEMDPVVKEILERSAASVE